MLNSNLNTYLLERIEGEEAAMSKCHVGARAQTKITSLSRLKLRKNSSDFNLLVVKLNYDNNLKIKT